MSMDPPPNSRRLSNSWTALTAEALAGDNQAQNPFPYGNWEEWMRWDGTAQTVSPKQFNKPSPQQFIKEEHISPVMGRQESPQAQPTTTDQPSAFTQMRSPVDMTALPTMDGSSFTFGEDRNNDAQFQFDDPLSTTSGSTPAQQSSSFYSDPLAWAQVPQNTPTVAGTVSPLTLEQQQHLRNIAFTPYAAAAFQQSPDSATGTRRSSTSSPEPSRNTAASSSTNTPNTNNNRKRKSSADDDNIESPTEAKPAKQPPVKKTAHNMIEKRYRTNLNDKIAALRDSVPSLRVMSRATQGNGDEDDDPEDLEGLTPAHKLNKATVLSKATEYIRHLEKRNKRLSDENVALKVRLNAFEKLAMTGSIGMNPGMGGTPSGLRYPGDPFAESASHAQTGTQGVPQGLIQVPESMRRLHAGQLQQHYTTHQAGYPTYQNMPGQPGDGGNAQGSQGRGGGGLMSKLMVGSLAGLMIMEGFSEKEQRGDQPNGRGLFALPMELLGYGVGQSSMQGILGQRLLGTSSFQGLLPLFKILLVVGALIYVLSPSFFDSKPKHNKKSVTAGLSAAPSLASPLEVRRKAWLTAIQTVWVPRHNFLLEVAALALKMAKLSIRNMIGWRGYALLTGATEEHEIARIKAWEIALDAQLAGGDEEISKSRLILTLMASATLPDTPARLMLRALHIRVLLWEMGSGSGGWNLFDELAAKLARYQWNLARNLQGALANSKFKDVDGTEILPDHLAELLQMAPEEVMTRDVIQRVYNLAWNRATSEGTEGGNDYMDSVVEDFAIRSPLDALSAWSSTSILNKAITTTLGRSTFSVDDIKPGLDRAYQIAPPLSVAQTRALLTKAILEKSDRNENISAVVQAMYSDAAASLSKDNSSLLMDNPTSAHATVDIRVAVCSAMALAHLRNANSSANMPLRATSIFNDLYLHPSKLSLIGFLAAYRLLRIFASHEGLANDTKQGLEHVAGTLRVWIGSDAAKKSGLSKKTRTRIVEECLEVSRKVVGMQESVEEGDAGYASLSEGEDKC
ncbi:hypothetical protein L228DRAFT_118638 [Xylona heveae TC161]|uniref:BHLH domain-containing protein n=1 Tax=Xylona heveae (strain CBS 132557 / TC161) TaxID=1328760 RepID=A0A165HHX3_XYLHT|nr:hypothetical protein L228DRAFT_118638 [Xylona heveae TC161]KZF23544.1 hypothetical protein L228DRAFT_118638 [Xylona heveae TC161]